MKTISRILATAIKKLYMQYKSAPTTPFDGDVEDFAEKHTREEAASFIVTSQIYSMFLQDKYKLSGEELLKEIERRIGK